MKRKTRYVEARISRVSIRAEGQNPIVSGFEPSYKQKEKSEKKKKKKKGMKTRSGKKEKQRYKHEKHTVPY
jgi:hypothetical protein